VLAWSGIAAGQDVDSPLAGPANAGAETGPEGAHDGPGTAHADLEQLGSGLPEWTVLPFAALLLCIAVLPLFTPHFWEHNRNKAIVAAVLSVPVAAYLYLAWGDAGHAVLHEKVMEYSSFIVLLAALFVITGGIHIEGSLSGTPLVNTGVLALGAVLANAIGTTGASVLLVRPLLRANAPRQRKVHVVVFFIFVVSNCGGLLTPLGDPPLFLGFLKGVPFEWTLRLWPQWLLVNGVLLIVFQVWDQIVLNREERERPGSQLEEVQRHAPLRIRGGLNFLFLAGVVATIYGAGRGLGNDGQPWPFGIQEGLMALLALAAWFTTAAVNREKNRFTFGPIVEVAVLFAGIFVTMAPALLILNAWGQGHREVLGARFGLTEPWQFYWASGVLSSFLDNAPTYLTFAATACGLKGVPVDGRYLAEFLEQGPEAVRLLAAISCGAVMMGANTYIGNGPNFMVKAIAEENGVQMPSFFGYMAYSGLILLPIFGLVTLVFFVTGAPLGWLVR
jgi:Na+/H+ antiporter NhaD/arsenite permease-like protein